MFQFHLETKAITEEKYFLRSLFNFCFLLTEQIFNQLEREVKELKRQRDLAQPQFERKAHKEPKVR